MALLQLKDIHKSFYLNHQEFKVLKGISLTFHHGEFVSLLGESGGGKSTLMNIIGGLDSNYQGDVELNGESLKHDTAKQLDEYRRKTIGFIFQNFNLIGHMSILDNVLVSLEMSKLSHGEQVKKATALLKRVGLGEHIHKHPGQLSGGQKQRVAIARALASDPDIIIADEPTGALDAQNTDEILKLLDGIAKEGKLVLTVTHSDKVAKYGTRVVHMQNGKIDSDKELRDRYTTQPEKGVDLHPLHFTSTFKMAFQQLMYNLKRNLLIIFGGAIGIFSVILMLGLGNGAKGYINHEIYSQINPNAVQISKNGKDNQFNQTDINKLSKIDNVKSVQKIVTATQPQIHNGKVMAKAQGLENFNATIKAKNIKYGNQPGNDEVVITLDAAKKINKKHPRQVIGKRVDLSFTTVNDKKQPVNLTRSVKVSGITDASMPAYFTNLNTIEKMYQAKKLKAPVESVALDIKGDVKNVTPAQDDIKDIQMKNGKSQYSIAGAGSIVDTLNVYVNLAVGVLTAIAAISLLVSAIMIIVVLYISVSERTKEIGILRALGVTKGNVRSLFFSESILLGVFSSIVATILAYLVQMGVNHAIYGAIGYRILQISPSNVIWIFVIAIIINLLAALLPAGKAAKLDPVESLSYE